MEEVTFVQNLCSHPCRCPIHLSWALTMPLHAALAISLCQDLAAWLAGLVDECLSSLSPLNAQWELRLLTAGSFSTVPPGLIPVSFASLFHFFTHAFWDHFPNAHLYLRVCFWEGSAKTSWKNAHNVDRWRWQVERGEGDSAGGGTHVRETMAMEQCTQNRAEEQ